MSDQNVEQKVVGLPDNAYSELKPGEQYVPLMSPTKNYPEINFWSVLWGLLMAVLFSGAAAYLGLKIGQVFEAAIPIAIIAVGLSTAFKRNQALGENVIIQSIGSASGAVVAGAIFTIPALYILNLEVQFFQVFMASLLGGFLGIIIGWYIWKSTKTLPDGNKVLSYNANDRKHGRIIFYLGIIIFPIAFALRMYAETL